MGTPEYAIPVLDALLSLNSRIVGVYTQPDRPKGRGRTREVPPIKAYALERWLDVVQPTSLRQIEVQRELAAARPDVIVVAAYGRILPPEVLAIPPHGCVNVHPSLLPEYRGPSPVATFILEGGARTGVTIMLMDEGMDTGPILASRSVEVDVAVATTDSLTARLFQVGADLLEEVLPRWLDGQLTPLPQDHGKATVTGKLGKGDGEARWDLAAEELERRLRAFTPWPGLFTYWKGALLKISAASVVPSPGRAAASGTSRGGEGDIGLVIPLDEPGIAVGVVTGRGVLGIRGLQLEGRSPVSSEEFLRGHRDLVGSILRR